MKNVSLLLYGLQRSDTNYLRLPLEKNCRVAFFNSSDRALPLRRHFSLYDDKTTIPEPQFRNGLVVQDIQLLQAHTSFDKTVSPQIWTRVKTFA